MNLWPNGIGSGLQTRLREFDSPQVLMSKLTITQKIADLEAQIASLKKENQRQILVQSTLEGYAQNSVIKFKKKFDERSWDYTYVALKIDNRWFLTSDGTEPAKTNAELAEFLTNPIPVVSVQLMKPSFGSRDF
jgi:N-methylhydantoinase B/oxoprolinase/acetone carboxylase alpha subunit